MPIKPRKLFDIDIDEMTLCKTPAIRKTFFIKKQETPMKELIEILKKFMADDEDKVDEALTKEEVESIEKLDGDTAKELKDALDILVGYQMSDIPDDALTAIRTFAKQASCGHPPAKIEKVDFLAEITDVKKAGARFSKATVAQLTKVRDMLNTLIGDKEKTVTKGHKDLPDDVKAELEALATLREENKERIEKEQIKKDEAAEERISKMEERLDEKDTEIEVLKKQKGIKKSIDNHVDDKDKKKVEKDADDDEDKWPSIPMPTMKK